MFVIIAITGDDAKYVRKIACVINERRMTDINDWPADSGLKN